METQNLILLIVDASVLITERLKERLSNHPFIQQILSAEDYDQAVSVLAEKQIDIVLMDIQLKEKSGIDLLKFISTTSPNTRVVVFTNAAEKEYIRVVEKYGVVYFLDKSRDFEKISSLIADIK